MQQLPVQPTTEFSTATGTQGRAHSPGSFVLPEGGLLCTKETFYLNRTRGEDRCTRGEDSALWHCTRDEDPRSQWGKCRCEAIASPHTARLPAAELSIDYLHGAAENPDPRRTIMTLTGHGMQERFEHVYLAAAAALAGITTFFRPLHIHWQLYHPPQSRGPAHLEVSTVAAQGWWVRVASKWILQQPVNSRKV